MWYFFRNEDLNAKDFFENADNGGQQQILRQNQVGGSIGGPIKKDKLFFYANYQETRQLNGAVNGIGYEAVILPPVPGGDRSAPDMRPNWAQRCAQPITRLIRAPLRPTLDSARDFPTSLVTDPTSVPRR